MRQAKTPGEFDQYVLEGAHVAIRLQDRNADRVRGPVGGADRPVQEGNAVVTFKIRRIRQHQVEATLRRVLHLAPFGHGEQI